jgi:long-chain acyl-CoA synthetase
VILGRTLPSLLDEACSRPNSRAFNQWTQAGWQPLSNQAFRTAAEEVALGLLNLQLEKGERVALLMHSDINFCIADMGCLLARLVDVPIDLTQTLENIIFILRHTEAKALIISNLDLLYQVVPYLWDTPDLKTVIVADVPANWQQTLTQRLTCQLSGGEDGGTRVGEAKEFPPSTCLYIPSFLSPARLQPCPEFPQCIQVLLLEEICARGRTLISESQRQQLGSALAAHDLATITYIPGAMGEPQGVMLTHENLSANALAMFTGIPNLELGAKEVILSFLPLTHVFARVLLYGHITYGHSIYFTTPNRVMKHLREVQPTIFATVPLLLEKVYSKILEEGSKRALGTVKDAKYDVLPRLGAFMVRIIQRGGDAHRQRFRLSSLRLRVPVSPFQLFHRLGVTVSPFKLRYYALSPSIFNWALNLAKRYELGQPLRGRDALIFKLVDRLVFSHWRSVFGNRLKYLISGGAALKPEVANLFAAAGVTILQGYGLTETSSAIACNRGQFNRAGTVGVPIAGVEIAIADDREILVRGPYVTQGYYKNPDATQQVIDADGWFHTGDLGEFTEDGFLKITGLKKSKFKLSTGKYVTPEPLESKLEKSPLVAKAIAVGSERKFCAMLIFPNLDALLSSAQALGTDLPTEALLLHPCIIALYQALVDEANCHLPYWSTVKRFQLIDATLTVENGMLTSTQQVRRAKVAEAFAKEIDAMYGDDKTQREKDPLIKSGDEQSIPLSLCPPVSAVSCPAFAQSLNRQLTT